MAGCGDKAGSLGAFVWALDHSLGIMAAREGLERGCGQTLVVRAPMRLVWGEEDGPEMSPVPAGSPLDSPLWQPLWVLPTCPASQGRVVPSTHCPSTGQGSKTGHSVLTKQTVAALWLLPGPRHSGGAQVSQEHPSSRILTSKTVCTHLQVSPGRPQLGTHPPYGKLHSWTDRQR